VVRGRLMHSDGRLEGLGAAASGLDFAVNKDLGCAQNSGT
jgi:hypothetical protein